MGIEKEYKEECGLCDTWGGFVLEVMGGVWWWACFLSEGDSWLYGD